MTDPERRRRVEDICDAALEHEADERAAFVASACGGDEALRREVDALLAHAEAADAFLTSPISEIAAQALAGEYETSLVGRQFGACTIVSLIGAGGMGEVYRAHDTRLDRDVAIKVVSRSLVSSSDRLARFEREAKILATLNHQHIGAIYGLEDADGVSALVLELVEGATLAERLASGPLPIQEALDVSRQIADALDAAHEKGIIHRDLKPANIKITPDGVVKVLDFGLAKVFAQDESEGGVSSIPHARREDTADGLIAGTAAYMSPEQARGKPVDKRTDIWAFGCVLYESLAGRPAFRGETVSGTVAAILDREPDWNDLPMQTPAGIRQLLRRCLEKDPKRRLRDIGDARLEVEEGLETIASSRVRPTPDSSDTVRRRFTTRLSRRTWWATVPLAIGGVGLWLSRRQNVWRNPFEGATTYPLTDWQGAEHHAAISPDGRLVAFLSDREERWDAWIVRTEIGNRRPQNLTQGQAKELRNPATRTLGFDRDGSHVLMWNRTGPQVDSGWEVPIEGGELYPRWRGLKLSEWAWAEDGRLVYHTPAAGDPMCVVKRDGEPEPDKDIPIYTAPTGFHNHFQIWSPDGAFIYFVQGRVIDNDLQQSDVWRIRPEHGAQPEPMTDRKLRVTFPVFLNNRTLLYLATDDDGSGPWIYGMDVEERVPRRVFTGTQAYTSLAASANGRRVVATEFRSTTTLLRLRVPARGLDSTAPLTVPRPATNGLSPRRGGQYLFYRAPKPGTIGLFKLELSGSGGLIELWDGVEGRVVSAPALDPDNVHIAFAVRKGGRTRLYVKRIDGTATGRAITGELDVVGAPTWSPDGRWIVVSAYVSGEPRLFKIFTEGGKPEPFMEHENGTDPIWAPSGRFLLYFSDDVGTNFSLKAASQDGSPKSLPEMKLTRGDRLAFEGKSERTLIVLMGDISQKDFYRVDLVTGRPERLTDLGRSFSIGEFCLSPDGREIIFERIRQESNIVLFDLPAIPTA